MLCVYAHQRDLYFFHFKGQTKAHGTKKVKYRATLILYTILCSMSWPIRFSLTKLNYIISSGAHP